MPLASSLGSLFKKGPTEYPVLLCGHPGAGKTTLVTGWMAAAGNPYRVTESNFTVHSIEVPACGKITFRDLKVDGVEDLSKSSLHHILHLTSGDSALLFVHDACDPSVEASLLLLHRYARLIYEYGGRGIWVVMTKLDLLPPEDGPKIVGDLKARFEIELSKYQEDFRWRVLDLPDCDGLSSSTAENGLKIFTNELSRSAPVRPSEWETRLGVPGEMPGPQIEGLPDTAAVAGADEKNATEWWDAFLNGSIAPWTHRDYIRAAFLTLLLPENSSRGILEVATDFASKVHAFKERPVPFPQQPESRTLSVFWIYHVKLAIDSCQQQLGVILTPDQFQTVLAHMPELLVEKLPTYYFSSDILRSKYSQRYWLLPDLHGLTELPARPDRRLGQQLTLKQQGDPERVLRLAFAVVQRYLRGDSSRRRSWFIDLGFASLHQQTIRLRTLDPSIPPYSLTHVYFFVQMVHVALSQLSASGVPSSVIQELSYPAFRDLFHITPTVWTRYYSPKKWYSLSARATFMPPDLQPGLPTRIDDLPTTEFTIPSHATYHRRGLIPELPSTDILNFHLAILLEDAKTLPTPLPASAVTSHATLLAYAVQNVTQPGPAMASPANIDKHIHLLSTSTSLSPTQASFWVTQVLQAAQSTIMPISPLSPNAYSISFQPMSQDESGNWHRWHNCPCHVDVEMFPSTGPSAVAYPHNYPYEHPPQHTHGCICHAGQELDHDAFARLCAEAYGLREEWEKQSRGLRERPASLSRDPWENFMRFNPVLAWEGLWAVYYTRKAWEAGAEPDRRVVDWIWRGEDRGVAVKGGEGKGEEGSAVDEGEVGESDVADQRRRSSGETKVEGDEDEWEIVG